MKGFPFWDSSVDSGICLIVLKGFWFSDREFFLFNAAFDRCAERSFSRALHSSFRSFRSTNGAAVVSFVRFLGGAERVKSVTRLSSTGFLTFFLFFEIPRTSLELSPILSRWVKTGDRGERFSYFPALVLWLSFCFVALTRKSKGRFRSSSRSSADEHDGLEISSVMGEERGKVGRGTCSSGLGFCCLKIIAILPRWFTNAEL